MNETTRVKRQRLQTYVFRYTCSLLFCATHMGTTHKERVCDLFDLTVPVQRYHVYLNLKVRLSAYTFVTIVARFEISILPPTYGCHHVVLAGDKSNVYRNTRYGGMIDEVDREILSRPQVHRVTRLSQGRALGTTTRSRTVARTESGVPQNLIQPICLATPLTLNNTCHRGELREGNAC